MAHWRFWLSPSPQLFFFPYSSVSIFHFILNFVLCDKFSKKFFFHRPVKADKPNFVSFLVFVGAAASFIAKILSFETIAKREAILNPVPKQ